MSPTSKKGAGPLVLSDWYKPFARQKQFHESKAKYRLFGGAAGPGKTKALLWEAIGQAIEVAGCDILLLRRTYAELESSLLAYFRRDVPRAMYKSYNEAKHVVTWENGSTTRFGYCRSENDVYQYQGAEFLFIGIDELTHFTLKQWQFLTSRNRCPVPGSVCTMAGATNPGNIGHAWVKALGWIKCRRRDSSARICTIRVTTTSSARGSTTIRFTRTMRSTACLLYTSPSPRDLSTSRMPSSA